MQALKPHALQVVLLACTALAIAPIVAFCAFYVGAEVPAYPWDHGAYWRFFQDYGKLIAENAGYWPRMILDLVRTSDYNPAAVVPLFPFYAAFGGGRTSYVTAISLLYLLPAALLAVWISLRSENRTSGNAAAIFVIALTYLPFWSPTLRGMVDIVGLIFLGLATFLVFRTGFLCRRPLLNGLLLGLLLWTPFLFRRWYAYSAVAFFAVAFAFGMIERHKRGQSWLAAGISAAAPLTIAGLLVLALVAAFQSELALRILTTSYGDIYDGYKLPLSGHLEMFVGRTGWYILAMMIVGVAVTAIARRIEAAFCVAVAVVTFFLFTHTQYMGVHHFLPVAFWLFPVYAGGVLWAARQLQFLPEAARALPFALIAIVIFGASVSPSIKGGGALASAFVPKADNKPKHLDNFPEYQRLIADLKDKLGPSEQAVILASSLKLSDSLLAAIDPSIGPHLSYASQIAKVSFFNFENLRAEFAVVTSPPQTHLSGSQVNITLPVESILRGAGFGAAYEKVPETTYQLAEGTTAYLYRRTREVTASEMMELVRGMAEHYPDWLDRFRTSFDIPLAARKTRLGDIWGRVDRAGPASLFIHPGASRPTAVAVKLDPTLSGIPAGLNLSVSADMLKLCPDADGVTVSIALDESNLWEGNVLPGSQERITLPNRAGAISITVGKRAQPSCDHLIATFELPN